MSALAITAIALVAVWLAALTVVLAALVRQIALIESRTTRPGAVGDTGLGVGTLSPSELRSFIPELWDGVNYVLFTSATCGPCIELVRDLDSFASKSGAIHAPVVGDDDMARDFVALFPNSVRVVRDPGATRLFELLAVAATPFVMEIEGGVITGKAYLRSIDDLGRLISARETSDARDIFEAQKGAALA
jgi:hypothetical protein